ncbi:hypothetical protein BDFB_005520, partial [Asbolus verrucosus]
MRSFFDNLGASICRRIKSFSFHSYRPFLCLPPTPNHHATGLGAIKEPYGSTDGIQSSLTMNLSFVFDSTMDRGGVMLWDVITYGSKSPLVFIEGTLTLNHCYRSLRP